jgi:hypothetical protein
VVDGATITLPAELEPNCGFLVVENNESPRYRPSDGCHVQLKAQQTE